MLPLTTKPHFLAEHRIYSRFTNSNCPLQVEEQRKLSRGFIYLLLIVQRMLLLPLTSYFQVGKSALSSYTKRSAHPQDFFLFFFLKSRKRKGCGSYLKKTIRNAVTNAPIKNNNIIGIKRFSIKNFWTELNVQSLFSHLKGRHHDTVLVIWATRCTKLMLLWGYGTNNKQITRLSTRPETKILAYDPEIVGSLPNNNKFPIWMRRRLKNPKGEKTSKTPPTLGEFSVSRTQNTHTYYVQ